MDEARSDRHLGWTRLRVRLIRAGTRVGLLTMAVCLGHSLLRRCLWTDDVSLSEFVDDDADYLITSADRACTKYEVPW